MSKYARRKDANHTEVQTALEKAGITCQDVSMFAKLGFDIIAKDFGDNVFFIEVKDGAKPLSARAETKSEQRAASRYPKQYRLVTSPQDALEKVK